MCYSLWYNEPTMLPAGGRQHLSFFLSFFLPSLLSSLFYFTSSSIFFPSAVIRSEYFNSSVMIFLSFFLPSFLPYFILRPVLFFFPSAVIRSEYLNSSVIIFLSFLLSSLYLSVPAAAVSHNMCDLYSQFVRKKILYLPSGNIPCVQMEATWHANLYTTIYVTTRLARFINST